MTAKSLRLPSACIWGEISRRPLASLLPTYPVRLINIADSHLPSADREPLPSHRIPLAMRVFTSLRLFGRFRSKAVSSIEYVKTASRSARTHGCIGLRATGGDDKCYFVIRARTASCESEMNEDRHCSQYGRSFRSDDSVNTWSSFPTCPSHDYLTSSLLLLTLQHRKWPLGAVGHHFEINELWYVYPTKRSLNFVLYSTKNLVLYFYFRFHYWTL